jgi:hypothetical protein
MRPFITLLIALSMLPACGGDDDSDVAVDAAGIDAPGNALGRACTPPDGPLAQGDCPDGYYCIGFPDGNHTFCAQRCTGMQDTSCDVGYAGPGYGACFVQATIDGTTALVCGVLCTDPPGDPTVCPDGRCTGACPTELACELALPAGLVACR